MIFEAILGVTDPSSAGRAARFAPMGASFSRDTEPDAVTLRPFASSRTGALLRTEGRGVLNFTDDVLLFAQTALTETVPPCEGAVLEGACEWWEIAVDRAELVKLAQNGERDDRMRRGEEERWIVSCKVLARHSARPFSSFNRGKNAVLEAVILATRLHLEELGREALADRIREWRRIAEKTGGEREIAAFDIIQSKL